MEATAKGRTCMYNIPEGPIKLMKKEEKIHDCMTGHLEPVAVQFTGMQL